MKIRFAYGKSGLDIVLPAGYEYHELRSRTASALVSVQTAIEAALDNPIGCAPLAGLARGKRSAAISVCDITRPAPNAITLPPLLQRLRQAGIPAEGVTILIATGLHRPATNDEIERIVGPRIASEYRVVNHDARLPAAHRYLGRSRRGTPAYIDERFMAADLHITLGFIEQHLMLGFSGGRKLIVPGLAAQETIKTIHSPRFMREPLAAEGSIDNNPLHAELLEIAAMARHDFLLDVTLTPSREISGVFAGHPLAAHAEGVRFLNATSLQTLSRPVDAVLTSAAGYPLDLTFYQSIKGVTAAQHVVKPGGAMLLLSECAEGIGSPEFARMLAAFQGYERFLDSLREAPVEIDQWQLEKLAMAGLKHRILYCTPGVSRPQLGAMAVSAFAQPQEALAAFFGGLPAGARVALIPDGPYTFARAL